MRRFLGCLALGGLFAASCALAVAADVPAAAGTPVPIKGGAVTLSPDNTKIVFVGTHSPPRKPDPRTCSFEKFSGKVEVDAEKKALKSVSVEIQTGSLKTEFEKLTNHLNSPDFFDTREHPRARFESTKITADKNGEHTITGKLTLLKTTKEVSFPAKVTISNDGLTLHSTFKIDRLDFGVGVNQDGVQRPVSLTVTIGAAKAK